MSDNTKTKKAPPNEFPGLFKVENADVVKHTLVCLIDVASSKTSKAYARITLKTLLKRLEKNHDLIRYITIEDADDIEDNVEAITVMSGANSIETKDVGRAIQNLVDIYKKELGKKAGYFFIREFRYVLGDDYHSIIRYMGVDLRLSELQDELYEWDSDSYTIKDHKDGNIAFLEKK